MTSGTALLPCHLDSLQGNGICKNSLQKFQQKDIFLYLIACVVLTRHCCAERELLFDDPHAQVVLHHCLVHKLAEDVFRNAQLLIFSNDHVLVCLQPRLGVGSNALWRATARLELKDGCICFTPVPRAVSVVCFAERHNADVVLHHAHTWKTREVRTSEPSAVICCVVGSTGLAQRQ